MKIFRMTRGYVFITDKCERGYCKNDAVCNRNENTRDAIVTCTCSEWYRGEYCETQVSK